MLYFDLPHQKCYTKYRYLKRYANAIGYKTYDEKKNSLILDDKC